MRAQWPVGHDATKGRAQLWQQGAPQVASLLLTRLQRESAADPSHAGLKQLLAEVSQLSGTPENSPDPMWNHPMPPPIFPLEFDLGAHTLKVYSMVSTFGTALDITADELRVETFFPADDFSKAFFRDLSA
jgi:hypothetical protein